jgi:hypothetical protein
MDVEAPKKNMDAICMTISCTSLVETRPVTSPHSNLLSFACGDVTGRVSTFEIVVVWWGRRDRSRLYKRKEKYNNIVMMTLK